MRYIYLCADNHLGSIYLVRDHCLCVVRLDLVTLVIYGRNANVKEDIWMNEVDDGSR